MTRVGRWRALPRRAGGGDRGAASAELVVAMPLLLLLLLVVVQFGVAEHAQHVAQAVADRALDVARAEGASAEDGRREAEAQMAAIAGASLNHPAISVTRDASRVRVEISGEAPAVLFGLHLRVSARSEGRTEEFTAATQSGG